MNQRCSVHIEAEPASPRKVVRAGSLRPKARPTLAELQQAVTEAEAAAQSAEEVARLRQAVQGSMLAELLEADKAVTVEGQVRQGSRHEKDDRSRVDDPRSWILGRSNARKVEALEVALGEVRALARSRIANVMGQRATLPLSATASSASSLGHTRVILHVLD